MDAEEEEEKKADDDGYKDETNSTPLEVDLHHKSKKITKIITIYE